MMPTEKLKQTDFPSSLPFETALMYKLGQMETAIDSVNKKLDAALNTTHEQLSHQERRLNTTEDRLSRLEGFNIKLLAAAGVVSALVVVVVDFVPTFFKGLGG